MTPFEAISGAPNACQVLPNLITAGQPSQQQFTALAATGPAIVVDMREAMEPRPFNEPATVKELGMEYRHLPIGPHTMNDATLDALRSAVAGAGDRTVLVHCASANRIAGALIPVLMLDQGMEEEDAVDTAMRMGLRSAELMEWGLDYARRKRG